MLERLFDSLRPFIRWVMRRPGLVLAACALLTAAALRFALQLGIDTELSNLIPREYPSVIALDRLREVVGGEDRVDVAVESPSFEANRAWAEEFLGRAMDLPCPGGTPCFERVEYRRDADFLRRNALYFATDGELDRLESYLEERIEEARLAANPLYFGLDDEEEEASGREQEERDLRAIYDGIVVREYPVSPDSTTLVLRFHPAGSQTDLGLIADLYASVDSLAAAVGPTRFHPEMQVTTAGRLLRRLTEVRTITGDVRRSFGAGVTAVLLVVVAYFAWKSYRARSRGRHSLRLALATAARMPVMAVLIGLPFLMSLSWTFALARLVHGDLNLMTSTLGLVLFGLGIDYGIHFYARYTEERGAGRDSVTAAEITFTSTGQAIAVSALTTAGALLVLMACSFKGFSQFGFIAGVGILFALFAMIVILPALVSLFEGWSLLRFDAGSGGRRLEAGRGGRFPLARTVIAAGLLAVAAAVVMAPGKVRFEYRFGELEPTYSEYNARREKIRAVFPPDGRRNAAYIVTDTPAHVPAVAAALRRRAAEDTLSPTIAEVVTIQDRFPMEAAAQGARLDRIGRIRGLLDDPLLEGVESEDLWRLKQASQTRAAITLDRVPGSLRDPFLSKSGEAGNFLRIYPSVGLSDGRNSIAFAEDVSRIEVEGRTYHAASPTIVAADVLRLVQRESPWMVLATAALVVLLMWLNFRQLRWGVLACLPLAVGVLWMLLLMELLQIRLNFYNMIVLPAVLGIGNDAGAHLVHRYRQEGRGSILPVLRSTGEHITVGSLTTAIGFSGPLLSFHPGIETIGVLAIVGIGATWLAAVLFTPALLQWLEDRGAGPHGAATADGAGVSPAPPSAGPGPGTG